MYSSCRRDGRASLLLDEQLTNYHQGKCALPDVFCECPDNLHDLASAYAVSAMDGVFRDSKEPYVVPSRYRKTRLTASRLINENVLGSHKWTRTKKLRSLEDARQKSSSKDNVN
ncbi:hypothetical protein Tco_0216057 [Tanacetum coccineum]